MVVLDKKQRDGTRKKREENYAQITRSLSKNLKKTAYIFFSIINDSKRCLWHFTLQSEKSLKPSLLQLHRTRMNYQWFLF